MPCMTFAPIYESGYKAIVRMSEEQPKWLGGTWACWCNCRRALCRRTGGRGGQDSAHPTSNSTPRSPSGFSVTKSCPPMEDEDKTIRERLRVLVVAFLAQDARKLLLARLQGQRRGAAEQEDALINTLIKTVSKFSAADAAKTSSSFFPRPTTDGRRGAGTSLCTHCSRAPPRCSGRTLRLGGTRRAWSSTRPSPVKSGSSEYDLSVQEIRQSTGSSHDTICCDVMCIECSVDGGTARYILHTTGNQMLGWMAIGFGRNMGDSPMAVVWPSCGADGEYNSVALSQRKAPYEVMPTSDPHPPFAAKLSITDTHVTAENPQKTK
ncbi:hypothetical protein EDB84DRAFT_337799 [Lactarius hengduanensis]|nr:hypothetical protein EDB84DRAFT_337799 [Lactarius hengduanensis]